MKKFPSPTNPHEDLPAQSRMAMVDYLGELRRQDRGVRRVGTNRTPVPGGTDPFAVPEWADTGMQTQAPTGKLRYEKGEAPAKAYIRSLGVDGVTASEVAEAVGCSVQLVRKLGKDPSFKAPSYEVPYGKNKIYIYTPDDVEEIRTYWVTQRQLRPRDL